jgi:hypothetical protein
MGRELVLLSRCQHQYTGLKSQQRSYHDRNNLIRLNQNMAFASGYLLFGSISIAIINQFTVCGRHRSCIQRHRDGM